uniref:Uncharacterized protein n=1 Tax=Anopheles atroparvus TaxID=41427 RepID=A0A182J2N4_ANOAO
MGTLRPIKPISPEHFFVSGAHCRRGCRSVSAFHKSARATNTHARGTHTTCMRKPAVRKDERRHFMHTSKNLRSADPLQRAGGGRREKPAHFHVKMGCEGGNSLEPWLSGGPVGRK